MPNAAIRLPITGEYSLDKTLAVLTMGRGNPCLRHDEQAAEITLNTPAGSVLLQAERAGESLSVSTTGPGAEWVGPHLSPLFGLADDPSAFQPEGRLRRIAVANAGLRLPRLPVVFDRLVQVVMQQLISFRDACRGWRLLVQRYGEPAPGAEGLFFPPTAKRLAGLASWRFTECDILPKHARLIQSLAKQAHALQRFWNAGNSIADRDRLCQHLLAQRGVGPWTVGYLRGAGLGDADAVVLGDYGHPHHVAHFFTGAARGSDEQMLELLDPYRPHRFRALMLLIQAVPPPPRRGPRRAPLRRRLR